MSNEQTPSRPPKPPPPEAPPAPPPAPAPAAVADTGFGEETELWRGRRSWRSYGGSAVLWLIATIVVVWLWVRLGGNGRAWVGTIAWFVILGSAVGVVARAAYGVMSRSYRLTSQRLFIADGLLSRTTDQTELIRVDDVRVHQSVWDRVFGVGRVEVVSTDATQPNLHVDGIRDATQVAEHIRNNMRRLRGKRSLYVESL